MTILYTQIQNIPDLQILTGTFSHHGQTLETQSTILKDLQEVIRKTPLKTDGFLMFKCTDNKFLFFIKIEKALLYSCITDTTTSEETVLKYFANIQVIFTKIYSPLKDNYSSFNNSLKESTNKFNRDANFIEIGANLEKTKGICADSLNLLLQRGENLKTINLLAEQLKFASDELKKRSNQMYLDTLVSKYGFYVVVLVVLFLFLYFIIGR